MIEERQSFIEISKAFCTALCFKSNIMNKATTVIAINEFFKFEVLILAEILFILHLQKHIMLQKYEKSEGKITYER
jgi:hypothetical protein